MSYFTHFLKRYSLRPMTLDTQFPVSVKLQHKSGPAGMHAVTGPAGQLLTVPGVGYPFADRMRNLMLCLMTCRACCDHIGPEIERLPGMHRGMTAKTLFVLDGCTFKSFYCFFHIIDPAIRILMTLIADVWLIDGHIVPLGRMVIMTQRTWIFAKTDMDVIFIEFQRVLDMTGKAQTLTLFTGRNFFVFNKRIMTLLTALAHKCRVALRTEEVVNS
jgi:hypothetical protein